MEDLPTEESPMSNSLKRKSLGGKHYMASNELIIYMSIVAFRGKRL